MNLQPKLTASASLQSSAGGTLTIAALDQVLALTIAPFFKGEKGDKGDKGDDGDVSIAAINGGFF